MYSWWHVNAGEQKDMPACTEYVSLAAGQPKLGTYREGRHLMGGQTGDVNELNWMLMYV
jgi:hypothetical protein